VESDQTNRDGLGNANADLSSLPVIALLAAALIAVGDGLFGDRSVVVEISNNTSQPLKLLATQHDSGGFGTRPPPEIPANTSTAFTSESKTVGEGTVGSVTYGGNGFQAAVGWHNPRVGANSTSATLSGDNKSRFLLRHQTGDGDSKAHMLYVLNVHPDYLMKQSLKARGDLSKGLRRLGTTLPISARALVDF
jgi:hypothetical protein